MKTAKVDSVKALVSTYRVSVEFDGERANKFQGMKKGDLLPLAVTILNHESELPALPSITSIPVEILTVVSKKLNGVKVDKRNAETSGIVGKTICGAPTPEMCPIQKASAPTCACGRLWDVGAPHELWKQETEGRCSTSCC